MKDRDIFKNKKNVLLGVLIILFIILTILVLSGGISYLDDMVSSFILGIRNDKMTNLMTIITNISSAYSLIVLTVLLLFFVRNKKGPLFISINLISAFLTSQIAKAIFRRGRPIGGLVEAAGFSYPSGHSMVSMAYFGFIAYLLYHKTNNRLVKAGIVLGSVVLVLLIGFSRIYLGVHYLSDVIGGFTLALIYLIIFIMVKDRNVKEG